MALDDHLKRSGFVPVESDLCIYRADVEQFFIVCHCNGDKSKTRLSEVKQSHVSQFDIKDLSRLQV